MVVFQESQQQRALNEANMVRSLRRELKADLRSGAVTLEGVLADPPWWLASIPVHVLLGYAPKLGVWGVERVLRRVEVWPLREVGRLTVRQRQRIVVELGRKGL